MGFDIVVSSLIAGSAIFRKSQPEILYKIGTTGEEPVLVMFTPLSASMPPIRTTFAAEDILANDWAIAQ